MSWAGGLLSFAIVMLVYWKEGPFLFEWVQRFQPHAKVAFIGVGFVLCLVLRFSFWVATGA